MYIIIKTIANFAISLLAGIGMEFSWKLWPAFLDPTQLRALYDAARADLGRMVVCGIIMWLLVWLVIDPLIPKGGLLRRLTRRPCS
ncbi:uncharacterized protein BDZ99DRAFT_466528 [Mytilinidion resinicola]|uniref:Uncharacterized protein n=1 Tax=Mytilinidion resinicola TaxID=574789 RepID=A0A6A6YAB2_9PEZI|nr:uncharacterized protein BDZ99DRAFT_466528 [Mytilinidion resinicola]KAF2805559.1 hypothetical protein BDZ99DRAFT_466528 [Mytilinidion resinicola]